MHTMDDGHTVPVLKEKSGYAKQSVLEDSDEDAYPFSYPKRGVAVIIIDKMDSSSSKERKGWEIDNNNLEAAFSYLDFDIRLLPINTSWDLLTRLSHVSQEDHSQHDCFVLAISSHGCEGLNQREEWVDFIKTIDNPVPLSQITEMFTDRMCPGLIGKPRLFFFQACRGDMVDPGTYIKITKSAMNENTLGAKSEQKGTLKHSQTPEHKPALQTPQDTSSHQGLLTTGGQPLQQVEMLQKLFARPTLCHKDFLIMYAGPPGYKAFRKPEIGSWFIRELTQMLLTSDGSKVLSRQLTKVIQNVAFCYYSSHDKPELNQKKQTPVIESMLLKDVYMAPKKDSQDNNVAQVLGNIKITKKAVMNLE